MTLEQYKQQVSEIHEAVKNFNGTPEKAVKFFEDLAKKYPEACEFNTKAVETKDLDEFKSLADSFGMKFSSDESEEKLFTMIHDSKKQLEAARLRYENGMELSDEDLEGVTGGGIFAFVVGAIASAYVVPVLICAVVGAATGVAAYYIAKALDD